MRRFLVFLCGRRTLCGCCVMRKERKDLSSAAENGFSDGKQVEFLGNNCPSLPMFVGVVLLFGGLAVSCLLLFSASNIPLESYYSITSNPQVNLDRVLKAAAMEDNKTIIITTLNDAWAEPDSIFDVFLESFKVGKGTNKLLNHLVVIALDQKAYARCISIHPHCYSLWTRGQDFSTEADFQSSDYLKMMWRRIRFLRVVLKKGYNFVFTDIDIVWLRDPFPHFYLDGDFQIACDYYNGKPSAVNNRPNGGFNFVRSSRRTIEFYKFWYQSRTKYPKKHDQDVLNKIKSHEYLSKIGLQMRFLDTALFGGFCQLSSDFNNVCTMHANCCVGLDNKINDLSLVLKDWRKYISSNSTQSPPWRVPQDCRDSFKQPHSHHKSKQGHQ